MAPVGAQRAATASSETLGSIARSSSRSDDTQPLDPVGHPVLIERLQLGTVGLGQADHQAAALLVGKVQLFGQGRHQLAALDVQPGHQGAVGRVKAGVDDGAVGLGGAATDVLFLVQNQDAGLIAGQLPGDGAAGHPCANDDDIGHKLLLRFLLIPRRGPSGRRSGPLFSSRAAVLARCSAGMLGRKVLSTAQFLATSPVLCQ